MSLETDLIAHRRRLGLTPLIDVIFLLLLFFMLSSTFSRFSDLSLGRIAAERQGAGAKATNPLFVRVEPTALRLNRDDVSLDDLTTLIASLGDGDIFVSLQDDTDSQRLVDVLTRLRVLEGRRVTVLE